MFAAGFGNATLVLKLLQHGANADMKATVSFHLTTKLCLWYDAMTYFILEPDQL